MKHVHPYNDWLIEREDLTPLYKDHLFYRHSIKQQLPLTPCQTTSDHISFTSRISNTAQNCQKRIALFLKYAIIVDRDVFWNFPLLVVKMIYVMIVFTMCFYYD